MKWGTPLVTLPIPNSNNDYIQYTIIFGHFVKMFNRARETPILPILQNVEHDQLVIIYLDVEGRFACAADALF